MKNSPGHLIWVLAMMLALAGLLAALRPTPPDAAAVQALAETRQSLRAQGFKTDLTDFNFTTTPEMRAREAILQNIGLLSSERSIPVRLNLMPPIGNDSALAVWKVDSLEQIDHPFRNSDPLSWEAFRGAINANQKEVDAACVAIMSGPIGFNLQPEAAGNVRLPHLMLMRNLAQVLCNRTVLALHDGNLNYAWTNWMAATRLVTAWQPEPMEMSHLIRFANTEFAFDVTWQALQTNAWSDGQLAQLQQDWASVDFLTNFVETAAYTRARSAAKYQRDRDEGSEVADSFTEFLKECVNSPGNALDGLEESYSRQQYNHRGSYEDEKTGLLADRDREVELRNALQSPTWSALRRSPGVTNVTEFQRNDSLRSPRMFGFGRPGMAGMSRLSIFLGRAAQAESQRRVVITALAVERYRHAHGSYPATLDMLTPDFLKPALPDFMDGQPLHYRLADDGHFLLYSIGLDCVDNGGKIRRHPGDTGYQRPERPVFPWVDSDIVWPLPAGAPANLSDSGREQTPKEP